MWGDFNAPALSTTWSASTAKISPAALHLNAGNPGVVEQHAPHEDIALDGEVEAVAHRIEVSDGRAHADAGLVVHGDGADARGVGAVEVGVVCVAAFHGGGVERLLHVGPGLVLPANDGDGTFAAVEVVLDVQVGLGLAEEGQDFQIGPLLVAKGRPPLEVFGQAAQVDLAVDGAGAADDLALGNVDLALLVVDGPVQIPGDRGTELFALVGVAVADGVGEMVRVGIVPDRPPAATRNDWDLQTTGWQPRNRRNRSPRRPRRTS